jgi:hypothetical protein
MLIGCLESPDERANHHPKAYTPHQPAHRLGASRTPSSSNRAYTSLKTLTIKQFDLEKWNPFAIFAVEFPTST